MKFEKEDLIDLTFDEGETLEVVEDTIVDTSRWSVQHKLIFKDTTTGKFYVTFYSVGATEYQDEGPFENEDDEIECDEVEPYEVTKTAYRKIA